MAKFIPRGSTVEDTSKSPKVARPIEQPTSTSFDTTSIIQITDVPSKSVTYGENTRIFAKTYPYREVKLLSDSQLPIDKQYEILLEGITTDGFDKNDLTLYDFFWVNIYRKLSSLGTQEYILPYYCPKCSKEGEHKFKLSDIPFEEIDVPGLPVRASFNSMELLTFMPLTVKDFINLSLKDKIYVKNGKGYLTDSNGERIRDQVSYLAAMCTNKEFEEAYTLISEVTDREDQRILEEVDSLLDHGMGLLEFECNIPIKSNKEEHPSLAEKCGNKIVRGLLGGESLIIPFRGHGKPNQARISFGS